MMLSARFLVLIPLVSLALATSDSNKAGPEKQPDLKHKSIKRKEICYRNVFGDEDLPEPKYLKPVLLEDGNRKQVWYSDGVKEDEHALELYYEEYCYRHHKKEVASSKESDVQSSATSTATSTSTTSKGFVKVSFFAGYEEKPVKVASPEDNSRENLANDRPFKHDEHDSDKADMLGFFMNFQAGYPGQDKCDEHGCWERRKVPTEMPEGYALTTTVEATVQTASAFASDTAEGDVSTATTTTRAHNEL